MIEDPRGNVRELCHLVREILPSLGIGRCPSKAFGYRLQEAVKRVELELGRPSPVVAPTLQVVRCQAGEPLQIGDVTFPCGEITIRLEATYDLATGKILRVEEAAPAPPPPPEERRIPHAVTCSNENPCCSRMDEYNGFGSDGPWLFTCPKSCPCHD